MEPILIPPTNVYFAFIPAIIFSLAIPIAGGALFTYIIARRAIPLVRAAPDSRGNRLVLRLR